VGAYFRGHPKYFKGPDQPRLGDLAYSELAMFPKMGEKTPWEMLAKKLAPLRYRWQNGRIKSRHGHFERSTSSGNNSLSPSNGF